MGEGGGGWRGIFFPQTRWSTVAAATIAMAIGNNHRRLMSIQSSDPDVKVIQELPSRKFWAETYVDLDSMSNEPTTAKVARWAKKHRDPVGKGDLILEFEVDGQYGCIIEMRAESDGFMGPQLVEVRKINTPKTMPLPHPTCKNDRGKTHPIPSPPNPPSLSLRALRTTEPWTDVSLIRVPPPAGGGVFGERAGGNLPHQLPREARHRLDGDRG